MIFQGYSRTTADMDVWIDRTEENYSSLLRAFKDFRMPIFDMPLENFLSADHLSS